MVDPGTLTPMKLAIVGLLWQQERSGYDLVKVFSETAMGGFSSSPGAIYPALKSLGRAGLITGKVVNKSTLRPRQVYRLTAKGTGALKWNLSRPVTRDDVMRDSGGVMLRFAFAGEVLGRDEAVRILDEFAHEVGAYLPELEAQLTALPQAAGPFGRLALQHGIDMYRADARWARKVAKELKQQCTARPTKRKTSTPKKRISK
jgi:DNA-binding PadR family transcriptional regulator